MMMAYFPDRRAQRFAACSGLAFVVAVAATVACAGGGEATDANAKMTHRETRVIHEECDVNAAGAERIDVNGDQRPDVTVVRSGGREVCRAIDLNFDGAIDSWVYRDARGTVTRRESDYDRDGRIDEVSIYRGGVLVEKDRATTLGGKLDTWHYYDHGKLARTERDSDGDSVVDQWWEYPRPDHPECPLIHSDVDGDGHPDPGASVDVCKEYAAYVPPERGEDVKAQGANFERSQALPTEVEQKPLEGEGGSNANQPKTQRGGGGTGGGAAAAPSASTTAPTAPSPNAPKSGATKGAGK